MTMRMTTRKESARCSTCITSFSLVALTGSTLKYYEDPRSAKEEIEERDR